MRRIGVPGALLALLLCLAATAAGAQPIRKGTIVLGVPRADFVVLGADRLWTSAVPRPSDPPWERRGRQTKIVRHDSLPLAVAAAGIASLGPEQDTIRYLRELIQPVDRASLDLDTLVARLRPHIAPRLRAIREPAHRALAANPGDAEARLRLRVARLTLLVAYVSGRGATLGSVQIDDRWQVRRESPPRGAVAWPNALDPFFKKGPYARATALFGYSARGPAALAEHVRRVIEAGIQADARENEERDRHVGGPVDVVLVDARGARCVRPCPTS